MKADFLYDRKICLQACTGTFQPGNVTGWGSEGVKFVLCPSASLSVCVCVPASLSVCLCLSVYLPLCVSVFLSVKGELLAPLSTSEMWVLNYKAEQNRLM